jgi:hypothetical protein
MEINISKYQSLSEVLFLLMECPDQDIVMHIEKNSPLFNQISNLRIISKIASSRKINLKIKTDDLLGKKIVDEVFYENSEEVDLSRYENKTNEDAGLLNEVGPEIKGKNSIKNYLVDSVLSWLSFSNKGIKEKNEKKIQENIVSKNNTSLYIIASVLGFLFVSGIVFYFYVENTLTSKVEIFVSAERFVKSQNVRLSTTQNTNIENRIFRGELYKGNINIIKDIETTGEIRSGVKAKGEVKLVNKSDNDIKLQKGEKLRYKKNDKEYLFQILEDIEIEARKLESTSPDVYLNTETRVDVEALDFGSSYNVAKGEGLKLVSYESEVLSAIVDTAIEGGLKEDLKAVSEDDIKKIYSLAIEEIKSSFSPQLISGKVFLKGSEQFSVVKTEYSHKLNEETDKIKLTLTVEATGLMYDEKEIVSFMRSIFKDIVPVGYELYGKELEVEANLLGKTTTSVLTASEGDIVATVKTYVIPILNTDSIKSQISGKNIDQVREILEEIPNITNYNLTLSINIPFLSKVPSDEKKIDVSIFRK